MKIALVCSSLMLMLTGRMHGGDISTFLHSHPESISTIAAAPDMSGILIGSETSLRAVNSSGGLLWSIPMPGYVRNIQVTAQGQILVSCRQNGVVAVGADGRELWRVVPPDFDPMGVAFDRDGNVYMLVGDTLTAVNSTGEIIWEHLLSGALGIPIVGLGERIIVHTKRGISCVARGGILTWETTFPEPHENDITADSSLLMVPRLNHLYALTETGAIAWSFRSHTDTWAAPVALTENSGVRAVSGTNILSLSRQGQLLWQQKLPRDTTQGAALIVDRDGTSYCIPSYGHSVIMVMRKDGRLVDKIDTGYLARPHLLRLGDRLLFCGIGGNGMEIRAYQTARAKRAKTVRP